LSEVYGCGGALFELVAENGEAGVEEGFEGEEGRELVFGGDDGAELAVQLGRAGREEVVPDDTVEKEREASVVVGLYTRVTTCYA
jgi:hypothetical protein